MNPLLFLSRKTCCIPQLQVAWRCLGEIFGAVTGMKRLKFRTF